MHHKSIWAIKEQNAASPSLLSIRRPGYVASSSIDAPRVRGRLRVFGVAVKKHRCLAPTASPAGTRYSEIIPEATARSLQTPWDALGCCAWRTAVLRKPFQVLLAATL